MHHYLKIKPKYTEKYLAHLLFYELCYEIILCNVITSEITILKHTRSVRTNETTLPKHTYSARASERTLIP